MNYNSQASQDKFILSVLKEKKNGCFLEIGSHAPQYINNTFILEKEFGWSGIMVEYDSRWLESYQLERPNSIHIMQDATTVDYVELLSSNNFPKDMDYLQIDLEALNRSTLDVLENLRDNVFDSYKFATVTFEHDIYDGDFFDTRNKSREIFQDNGYILTFPDVKYEDNPFEDWYIHPDLVDIDYINSIKSDVSLEHSDIAQIL